MRYMFWYLEKNCVFSAALNLSSLSVGSQRLSGRELQVIGPTAENVRRSNRLWLSWNDELVAAGRVKTLTAGNIRSRYAAVHEVLGTLLWRHRKTVTPSLYSIRSGTSSQCSSEWHNCVRPRSNFPVPLTTQAAAFSTRWSLSVVHIGDPTNTVWQ